MMYLAQLNIAEAIAPADSPILKEFTDNLDPINAIAESSDGFIWRLQDETGNATNIQLLENPLMLINMSVWQSPDHLKDFLFKTHHLDFLKRKALWFKKLKKANHVMWWITEGSFPTLEEGKERLLYLREHADSPYAFTFKHVYAAEEATHRL